MIPGPLLYYDLQKDTLCRIGGTPGLVDLSARSGRWLLARSGMRGAPTLSTVVLSRNGCCAPPSLTLWVGSRKVWTMKVPGSGRYNHLSDEPQRLDVQKLAGPKLI